VKHHHTSPQTAVKSQTLEYPLAGGGLDLTERCRTHASPALQALLQIAARTAEVSHVRAYAVGGFVRDLLLGVRDEDLDLSIEGDGVAFARQLAAATAGICKAPSAFGTAVVIAGDGHKIDVATARRETYKQPAALPTVEPGSIRDDLYRRDFSINTMALVLNGPQAFTLLDWFGGHADLDEGVIRVLHNRSFRDDPTRIFRAIRLAQRFGFTLHRHTLLLLQRAADKGWIELLSGARLWREFRLMLEGESPVACLRRLDELGILPHIDADLRLSPLQLELLTRVAAARVELAETHADVLGRAWPVYLAALCYGFEAPVIRRISARLVLSPRLTQELIAGLSAAGRACDRLLQGSHTRPSEVVAVLRTLPPELLPLLLALCPGDEVRQQVEHYLTTWRHIRAELTGDDLKRLGVPQGRHLGQLLTRLLAAKLDGEVTSREAEEALVRRMLAETSIRMEGS
jgi:tRNA nucleotidyltransferase (CCA-adding enzyme)